MASAIQDDEANDLDDGDVNENDDLYDFTEDQIQAMLELDLMQKENAEYPNIEVRERLEELNNALANDPTPIDDSRRESRVVFKENLVDLIAPAPDYPSDFDEEEEVEQSLSEQSEVENETANEDEDEDAEKDKTEEVDAPLDDRRYETVSNNEVFNGFSNSNEEVATPKPSDDETVRDDSSPTFSSDKVSNNEVDSNGADDNSSQSSDDSGKDRVLSSSSLPLHSDDSKSESFEKEEKSEISKNEEDEDSSNQVLVERNGRYILTNKRAVEADDEALPNRTPHPPASKRPDSAPQRRPARGAQPRARSGSESATSGARCGGGDHAEDGSNYVSPYAMSPEMREERQRRMAQRQDRAKSAEVQRRNAEKDKRETADAAFQAWLRQKREKSRDYQRRHDDKASEQSSVESQERNDEALKQWMKKKRQQKRREVELRNRQLEAMYVQEQMASHNQEEIDKAFRSWLRRKNRESKIAAQEEKQRARITRLAVRQCRKSQALAFALHRDSSLRFMDYYGYRS